MNKVVLIGRLTRDPELKYTPSNIAVVNFSIAVNRNFTSATGEREADFINIIVWRKQAENVKKYVFQGSQVAVEGRIQTRNYTAEDGTKRYITEVVADNVEFLGSKNSSNTTNNSNYNNNYNNNNNTEKVAEPTPYDFKEENKQEPTTTNVDSNPFADFGSSIEINDNELPF